MNGNGLSAGDVLALSRDRDDGFFGDGIWGIIMLLIVAGLFTGNGFGWGNNRGNGFETDIDTRFLERDIFNTNQNVSNTACQTQRDVLENRYNLGSEIQENRFNCSQNACATQKEILQNRYDNALQTQTLSSQMAQCCCDLKAEGLANTQKILDKLCDNEINQLRTDLQSAQLQISQLSQTANITNTLRPYPQPSYIVTSPYMSVYNPYGCGCGSNSVL